MLITSSPNALVLLNIYKLEKALHNMPLVRSCSDIHSCYNTNAVISMNRLFQFFSDSLHSILPENSRKHKIHCVMM